MTSKCQNIALMPISLQLVLLTNLTNKKNLRYNHQQDHCEPCRIIKSAAEPTQADTTFNGPDEWQILGGLCRIQFQIPASESVI